MFTERKQTVHGGARVAQQVTWFAPVVTVLAIAATTATARVVNRASARWRSSTAWFGCFAGLTLVGVLREATIIGSSGEPIVDLLVAFGPLTLGGMCLLASLATVRDQSKVLQPAAPAVRSEVRPFRT